MIIILHVIQEKNYPGIQQYSKTTIIIIELVLLIIAFLVVVEVFVQNVKKVSL